MQVQIAFKDMPHSDALERHIRERAARLAHFHPHIVSCHVSVEMPHKHHQQGRLFNLRIDLRVPGGEIVVNRDHGEDVYVALRDAFDAATREIEEFLQRRRGEVKHHEPRRAEPEEGDDA